jgi:hypothetical protein
MRMTRSTLWTLVIALLFVLLVQAPQWIHMASDQYRGIVVHLSSDEYVYLARVQEALNGRPEQADEAMIGEPELRGTQGALLEQVVGTVFRPFGWRAATVLQVMDVFVVFFMVLCVLWFFRLLKFSKRWSFLGTIFFCLILLYDLNRPIHQGLSFLVTLTTLCCIMAGLERNRWLGILGSILLGLLLGVYFWSWTFAWLWVALLLCLEAYDRWRSISVSRDHFKYLMLWVGIAAVCALPFIYDLWSLSGHPMFSKTALRSGIRHSRLPESWIYSILFLAMGACTLASPYRSHLLYHYRFAVITVITAVIVIHQQIVHGVILDFVSHYLFFLVLAAVTMVLLALHERRFSLICAAAAACVYLAGIAVDAKRIIRQWTPSPGHFAEQQFAGIVPVLDQLPRARILSDARTSLFIAGATHHDVVSTLYSQNTLMSDAELAERYCLTRMLVSPEEWRLSEQGVLIHPAKTRASDEPDAWQQEVAFVEAACDQVHRDIPRYLHQFGITRVLWNQELYPIGDVNRLGVPVQKIAEADGIVLWSIIPTPTSQPE